MTANFTATKYKRTVNFRDLSTGNPTDYHWDFGDGNTSTDRSPTHTYAESGFYVVTLKVSGNGLEDAYAYSIGVSEYAKTQLSDSIYVLIDTYVPEEFKEYLSDRDRRVYIEKWQLYLCPLVCSCIPVEEYNNESRYEALENQLIMELAAWEHLLVVLQGLLKATSKTVETSEDSEEDNDGGGKGRVKQIETGPTSVQWYEGISGTAAASLAKVVTGALQPGGFIDTLKENICMLGYRLGITLPICPTRDAFVKVPRKVNPRKPGPLGGPNPTSPLRRR